jgi:hypothetical protein
LGDDRLADRQTPLENFDDVRRDLEASGTLKGMDAFAERAFGLLTPSRTADALDLSKEPPRVIER